MKGRRPRPRVALPLAFTRDRASSPVFFLSLRNPRGGGELSGEPDEPRKIAHLPGGRWVNPGYRWLLAPVSTPPPPAPHSGLIMNVRLPFLFLALALALAGTGFSAEESAQPTARERMRARLTEDAKKTAPGKSARPVSSPPATSGATPATSSTAATSAPTPADATPANSTDTSAAGPGSSKSTPATKAKSSAGTQAKAKQKAESENPTLLPQVEVKKGRITVLDQKLAQQEMDIARERKNLQVSEVDSALNDSKIARPLSIFGGDSAQFRQGVASERVELMEAEKDLIEAIAFAKTKEEKAALQKQLNELKAMRRELDKSMR